MTLLEEIPTFPAEVRHTLESAVRDRRAPRRFTPTPPTVPTAWPLFCIPTGPQWTG